MRTPAVPVCERSVLAQRLVAARTAKGWRQRDVAAAADVDQRQIAGWETDINGITVPNIIAVADVLGVSIDWLVGRTDLPEVAQASPLASPPLASPRSSSSPDGDACAAPGEGLRSERPVPSSPERGTGPLDLEGAVA